MSIKLKNKNGAVRTFDNVHAIKLKDENNNDVLFYKAMHQKTVFLKSADDYYSAQENGSGVATTIPVEPTREGFVFKGWSEISHDFIPANKVNLPKVYNVNTTLYAMWLETPEGTATISNLGNQYSESVAFNVSETFPNTFEKTTDAYNNVFIKIPTMYRKINSIVDGQIISYTISPTKINDSYKPYPCFLKEDGVTVMPYILVGRYLFKSASEATSVSEGSAVRFSDIGAARSLARNLGSGYQILDWQISILIRDLLICINKAFKNFVNVFDFANLEAPTYIDGIWQKQGVDSNHETYVFSYKPSKYVNSATQDSQDYVLCSYSYNKKYTGLQGSVEKVGYDADNEFFNFIANDDAASVDTNTNSVYYCATFSKIGSISGKATLLSIPYSVYGTLCDSIGWSSPYARLCYRPID